MSTATMPSARTAAHLTLVSSLHEATGCLCPVPFLSAEANVSVPPSYKDALWSIVRYATQVRGYKLPQLKFPDKWPGGKDAYNRMQITWINTTAELESWALSSLEAVLKTPKRLLKVSDTVVLPGLDASVRYSAQLIQNPTSQPAKNALRDNLDILFASFNQYATQTGNVVKGLQSHAPVFDNDARVMNEIADNALKAAGNQRTAIEDFQKQIDQLNREITAAAVSIGAGSLITLIGIGMGVVGVVLAPFTSGVSLVLLIPAFVITAGGVAIIALNAVKIKNAKTAIEGFSSQIDQLGAEIAVVNAMSTTLRGFSGQIGQLKESLGVVVKPWQDAAGYLLATQKELNNMQSSEDWRQVNGELTQIVSSWNELMKAMKQLEADATVNPDSKLELGMNEDEVKRQMSGSRVSLIDYLVA